MPMSIFRVKTLLGANITGFIMGTILFSMFLLLTLYMQQVLGMTPLQTGLGYLAVAGTAILWANVAALLSNRLGVKPILIAGMSLLGLGLVWFTQISVDGSYWTDLFPGFLLVGIGMPFVFVRHDRGGRGRQPRRGRPRFRSDQHVAADRRRARDRRARRGCEPRHRERDRGRHLRRAGSGRRVLDGVLDRRRRRSRRGDRDRRVRAAERAGDERRGGSGGDLSARRAGVGARPLPWRPTSAPTMARWDA